MIVIVIIVLLVCCYGIKISSDNGEYLSVKSTNAMKGICALIILLDHIGLQVENPGILKPFTMVGYLCVALFFFFSGYGLCYQFIRKSDYLKNFLLLKCSKLLIPTIITALLYLVVVHTEISYSWFIYVILAMYLLFFVCFKVFNKINYAIIVICAALIVYQISCILLSVQPTWYKSVWAFAIGIIYAFNYQRITDFIKNHYIRNLIISFMLFIISFGMGSVTDKIIPEKYITISETIFFNLATVFVIVSICTISMKVNFYNKIIEFVGKISFEIYILQGLFFKLYKPIISNIEYGYIIFALISVLSTIFVSVIVNRVSGLIHKKCFVKCNE